MDEIRSEPRAQAGVRVKFKSESLAQFVERYSVDISRGGMFIRTRTPLAAGTSLRFEFQLQDASPLFSGDGTVAWTRTDPGEANQPIGMGVRFERLEGESARVLDEILRIKDGLPVPDGAPAGDPFAPGASPPSGSSGTPPPEPSVLASLPAAPQAAAVPASTRAAAPGPAPAPRDPARSIGIIVAIVAAVLVATALALHLSSR